jgi:hypothetical protein
MMVLRKRAVRANFDIDLRFYYIFLKIYLKYILRDTNLLCFLPSAEREVGAYCFRPASIINLCPVRYTSNISLEIYNKNVDLYQN